MTWGNKTLRKTVNFFPAAGSPSGGMAWDMLLSVFLCSPSSSGRRELHCLSQTIPGLVTSRQADIKLRWQSCKALNCLRPSDVWGKLEETVEETPFSLFSHYGWLFCPLATWPCVPEEPFPKGRSQKCSTEPSTLPAGTNSQSKLGRVSMLRLSVHQSFIVIQLM